MTASEKDTSNFTITSTPTIQASAPAGDSSKAADNPAQPPNTTSAPPPIIPITSVNDILTNVSVGNTEAVDATATKNDIRT